MKTKEANDFSKSEAEMVDVHGHTSNVISIIEKEMAKNSAFLQKEINIRNTDKVTVLLKTSMPITCSKQCQTCHRADRTFYEETQPPLL